MRPPHRPRSRASEPLGRFGAARENFIIHPLKNVRKPGKYLSHARPKKNPDNSITAEGASSAATAKSANLISETRPEILSPATLAGLRVRASLGREKVADCQVKLEKGRFASL